MKNFEYIFKNFEFRYIIQTTSKGFPKILNYLDLNCDLTDYFWPIELRSYFIQ
jgi:hypothetical protein